MRNEFFTPNFQDGISLVYLPEDFDAEFDAEFDVKMSIDESDAEFWANIAQEIEEEILEEERMGWTPEDILVLN